MTYSLGTSPNAVCLLKARNLSLPYHGLVFNGSKDIFPSYFMEENYL